MLSSQVSGTTETQSFMEFPTSPCAVFRWETVKDIKPATVSADLLTVWFKTPEWAREWRRCSPEPGAHCWHHGFSSGTISFGPGHLGSCSGVHGSGPCRFGGVTTVWLSIRAFLWLLKGAERDCSFFKHFISLNLVGYVQNMSETLSFRKS